MRYAAEIIVRTKPFEAEDPTQARHLVKTIMPSLVSPQTKVVEVEIIELEDIDP